MTEKDLKKLTKDELEILCREKGVELDKRLTKAKLVKEALSLFGKEQEPKVERRLTFRERYELEQKNQGNN